MPGSLTRSVVRSHSGNVLRGVHVVRTEKESLLRNFHDGIRNVSSVRLKIHQGLIHIIGFCKGLSNGKCVNKRLARTLSHIRHHQVCRIAYQHNASVRPLIRYAINILQRALYEQFGWCIVKVFGIGVLVQLLKVDKIFKGVRTRY